MLETVVAAPVTPETVTPLKPSEALRLGRLKYPRRISYHMFDGRGGACALGALVAGYGRDEGDVTTIRLMAAYDIVGRDLGRKVWIMNDNGADEADIVAYLESFGL